MTEYKRVRELLESFVGVACVDCPYNPCEIDKTKLSARLCRAEVDYILSLVEIKSDDQSLPESILSSLGLRLVNATVKVFLKAGFIRVIPKEE